MPQKVGHIPIKGELCRNNALYKSHPTVQTYQIGLPLVLLVPEENGTRTSMGGVGGLKVDHYSIHPYSYLSGLKQV